MATDYTKTFKCEICHTDQPAWSKAFGKNGERMCFTCTTNLYCAKDKGPEYQPMTSGRPWVWNSGW